MLRLMSQSWIKVGIKWTRVAFWPSSSDTWSLFFFSQSPLLWSLCILAGYQSGAVSPSAGFPERRGVPPRPAGPGPVHTNTGRKQRSLDSMKSRGTTETSGRTRKRGGKNDRSRGKELSGTKETLSFMTLYCTGTHMHVYQSLNNLYAL